MNRLGALLVAGALIGGAVFLTASRHDSSTDGDTTTDTSSSSSPVRVVCAAEFRAACRALASDPATSKLATFTVEAPGVTSAALATGKRPAFDLWLVSLPWPGLTKLRAAKAGKAEPPLGTPSAALAASELQLVARTDRLASFSARCSPKPFDGACAMGATGQTYPSTAGGGAVRFGIAPTTDTAGLLTLAAFTGGWFPSTDFDELDLSVNTDFQTQFGVVKADAVTTASPIRELLTIPKFSATFDLNVAPQLADAADGDRYGTLSFAPPSGPMTAQAVAVPVGSRGTGALGRIGAKRVTNALLATGWKRGSAATPVLTGHEAVLDRLVNDWSQR
ncbi:MAG: hypothetical protein U0Q22_04175 [Acidimicrobiales bacterium]